ncbi:P-loop containing nucleoside triphosphate hydrolase protein [Parathielavia hyrcaniae]|uniref:P-loop containing nucleoside triphosphate hydrolase protein n=1 Tax=Parathielavia hyrcaniae TaxID=113614 RepID=A0AAN6Q1Z1_9PEZI|nr:P-loop containing nucleoside triphosphate hydrolase protein [Parathielavia hyrcaniae]
MAGVSVDETAQPAGLAAYQAVFSNNKPGKPKKPEDAAKDNTKVEDKALLFNSKFEDIKEIRRDGEVVTVTRSQNQYKRSQQSKKRFGEYSLLLRRVQDLNDRQKPTLRLELQSDTLRHEFRRLAQGLTSIRLNQNPIVIREPFRELYYYREQVRRTAYDKTATEEVRREMQLLVDFEAQYMSQTIATVAAFSDSGSIDFDFLWSLFAPGRQIVLQNTSAAAAAIEWLTVIKSYEVQDTANGPVWVLTVTHTGFNGHKFGTVQTRFTFPSFSGTIEITQLPAYPLEYCPHRAQLANAVTGRGQKYEKYCLGSSNMSKPPAGTIMMYEGPFWTMRDEEDKDSRKGCRLGRVVVDVEGFLSEYPVFRDKFIPAASAAAHGADGGPFHPHSGRKPLSDDERLTCPPFVPAFSFSARRWGLVLVEKLEDVEWNEGVYDKLKMKGNIKATLRGIVRGHSTHLTDFDDFIQGKGRGLVCLLHGPPGCGKTMTAESIAESLQKPLYSVNAGELGTSPNSIQGGLERAFGLVSRWDAIFLLDEADTFLARRSNSVEKNAPISGREVFLRLLEYQAGIIFLTTNRVLDIDDAFHSRIHITIPYDELDDAQRTSIWRDLAHEKCACTLTDVEASGLGALPVDGRTIKKVLRLATLFAKTRDDEADMCINDIVEVLPLAIRDSSTEKSLRGHAQGKGELENQELLAAVKQFVARFQMAKQ